MLGVINLSVMATLIITSINIMTLSIAISNVTLQDFLLCGTNKLSVLGVVILSALAPLHLELQSMSK